MKTSIKFFSKRAAFFAQALLIASILTLTTFAAGEVDPNFNASAYKKTSIINTFNAVTSSAVTQVVQPDGKILIGGVFEAVGGVGRSNIARLNPDGTVDVTFNSPQLVNVVNDQSIELVLAIGLQSNGKIIVGGRFNIIGATYKNLIRLNADGSLDTSFTNTNQFTDQEYVKAIVVRPDDTIYIGGSFDMFNGSITTHSYARLNSNGAVDSGFYFPPIVAGVDIAVQADDKIYISLGTVAQRHIGNGARDTSFPYLIANAAMNRILVQPDGKIIVAGPFTSINGFALGGIARINTDGSIDPTFNPNGVGAQQAGFFSGVIDAALAPDGKIVIVGSLFGYNGVTRNYVARLNADGSLDNSFNSPLTQNLANAVKSVKVQADGKVIITGINIGILRLNTNGTVDASFNSPVLGFGGTVNDVIQQPDGKILAGGNFIGANNAPRGSLARYNADGTLDTTFNPVDLAIVNKLALQADGKILVGRYTPFNQIGQLNRLNADGSIDTGFTNLNVLVRDIEVLPDGKILVNGVIRLLPNGAVDSSYASSVSSATVYASFLQPDGKVLIGGTFTQINSVARGRIARLNADGTLDATFAPPFGANGDVYDITRQADGKVVVVGSFTGLNGNSTRSYIGRLNADGSLDESFAPSVNNQIKTVRIQPNGKILIGGLFTAINGVTRNRYARLNANGALDASFLAGNGADNAVHRIEIQADGKILLGGDFNRIMNVSAVGIARLLNVPVASRPLFDFDGDGRADLSIFRPSNGFWYLLNVQTSAFSARQFGANSDLLAPADYDGDGKTDIAVFRPGAFAYFYIFDSSTSAFRFAQFGTTGDLPMAGDWDGDGRADLAVYRAASTVGGVSNFYYRPSSQPTVDYLTIPLGTAGDRPLYGDFDGDGRLDPAVFRASSSSWIILRSSLNQISTVTFGLSTDIPVPADYDGDGQANIAVFRPSTGYWYTSTNPQINFGAIQFGAAGDVPVPADYDGDGKADTAVFRPSNGGWYLNRTTSGFTGVQFGISGDKPAPNAFIR